MKKIYFLLIGFYFFGSVHAQIVNIPDANFKAALLKANPYTRDIYDQPIYIDSNNDGEIQLSEAQEVFTLNVSNSNISSLEGLSSFTNLGSLGCDGNKLTTLDLKGLSKLFGLNCSNNKLVSIDNTQDSPILIWIYCNNNNLTFIDLVPLINLKNLICYNNKLTSLNLCTLNKLGELRCNNNQLTSLDLCNKDLISLSCQNNNLSSLNIKNATIAYLTITDFSGNENLQYICANESQFADIEYKIYQYGYTNCHVNSYCSFVPGGAFFTIEGNSKYDQNINGCDSADSIYPDMKFSFSNGIDLGNLISNATGYYSVSISLGNLKPGYNKTYKMSPIIENPSYFSVYPTIVEVTNPIKNSIVMQDFCITPNGVHPDLEVSFLPIDRARPGFDASYKIIYKNKGTTTQSGSVNLTFDDSVLDFVSANPVVSNQSADNLFWEYIDLKPFETRAIEVTLNVNSPMETPAVNNGDRLSFTALINPVTDDELPVDNSFALRQLVVGSYDPNDKTCLEGSTIAPSAVGKYVHYLIRFENKGTAEAINVVIKDMIDTSKFDVSSLVVTEGSHSFVTKISDTNKVEFIFEKINLPFDDATNDGYVAFKIKTKPSLVLGDSFSNTASIYFDYNFPIITNTATTSVLQSLGTQDFEFSSYFKVYPNPAKQVLNIDVKKQIELSSISIFNTLGQQILVIPNAQQTKQVDVSSLKTGNYFIKVTSNKGSASGKFVKE